MTLQELKLRPINTIIVAELERTLALNAFNIEVYRNRMNSFNTIQWNIDDITHDGNSPRDNERMLDIARVYIKRNVYTDDEWEKYFIPAINKIISYNDNFKRWYPGYLIREKETGKLAILEYDYSTAFGGRNYTSLSICELDNNGEIYRSWAWANYNNYELIDSEHISENITKIRDYRKNDNPPYFMRNNMIQLLYSK